MRVQIKIAMGNSGQHQDRLNTTDLEVFARGGLREYYHLANDALLAVPVPWYTDAENSWQETVSKLQDYGKELKKYPVKSISTQPPNDHHVNEIMRYGVTKDRLDALQLYRSDLEHAFIDLARVASNAGLAHLQSFHREMCTKAEATAYMANVTDAIADRCVELRYPDYLHLSIADYHETLAKGCRFASSALKKNREMLEVITTRVRGSLRVAREAIDALEEQFELYERPSLGGQPISDGLMRVEEQTGILVVRLLAEVRYFSRRMDDFSRKAMSDEGKIVFE